MTYVCQKREYVDFPLLEEAWQGVPEMQLVNTVDGEKPGLATEVQAFWNEKALYFRFVCEDTHVVAAMANHDDPIYKEDVVEVFLCETGDLTVYKEFEVSPTNVKFDALIHNDRRSKVKVATEWHAVGWKTAVLWAPIEVPPADAVSALAKRLWSCVWELPFANFEGGVPSPGTEWRLNCYRIDRNPNGADQYQAWSPTGVLSFHIPERFGWLRFEG